MAEFLNKRSNVWIVIIVIFAILLAFGAPIKNFTYKITQSLKEQMSKLGSNTTGFFYIFAGNAIKKENQDLKSKIQELEYKNNICLSTQKENQDLKDALGIGIEKSFKLISCQITDKDLSRDSLTINKGEKDGVLLGMPLITPSYVVIGRVVKVFSDYSQVTLITKANYSFNVKILKETVAQSETSVSSTETTTAPVVQLKAEYIETIAKGRGNFNLYMDFLQKNAEFSVGQKIFTSALGNAFPKNLLIGKIEKINKPDNQALQEIKIEPYFNPDIDYNTLFLIFPK